jgi:pre-mRNA-processing factor SLU7
MSNQRDELNQNMPGFIAKAPWYVNQQLGNLKHQDRQSNDNRLPITIHTQKGITSNMGVYKYRKGACENCGSMTHKLKECCERPRKRGAKFTGKNFQPDEFIYEVPLDYEGKRDRWNGYDPDTYKKLVYEYDRYQEEKKRIKLEQIEAIDDEGLRQKMLKDDDLNESISSEDDGNNRFKNDKDEDDKFDEEQVNEYIQALKDDPRNKDVQFEKISNKDLYSFATSKSLNIGDDYSKYLISLSLNSAYYDPKSRSMREDPLPESNTFKGDNASRNSGDTVKLLEVDTFIKEANAINKDLNVSLLFYF